MTPTLSLEKTREDATGEGFVLVAHLATLPVAAMPAELTSHEARQQLGVLGLSTDEAQAMIDTARLAFLRQRSVRIPHLG
jgi:hypothetical protein